MKYFIADLHFYHEAVITFTEEQVNKPIRF